MSPAPLGEHHVRHIVTTFAYVDELLGDIERIARTDSSPFARARPDLDADEAALVLSYVALLRERMLTALDRLGIPRPEPHASGRWHIATTLTAARVALADLAKLHGYGPVGEDTVAAVDALAGELSALLARMGAALHEREPGGLIERLAALDGVEGEVLRALERRSREQGLVELRTLIAAAVERAADRTFEVGVFGRVSSGKSSLLNALAGIDVLPVGATPVTAVPVRLRHGDEAVRVRFQDGEERLVALAQIADYVTLAANPGNRLGVASVEIALPSLPAGIRLLDTPGIGSLASGVSALSFAWLPRCDLGLVLVPAGAPFGREELALVAGLAHAGIACEVLLSKCDLLSDAEREAALAYLRGELARVTGPAAAPRVWPASTVAGFEATLADFRAAVLEPALAQHRRAHRRALHLRLRRLLVLADAALTDHGATGGTDRFGAQRAVQQASERLRAETQSLAASAPALLAAAAHAVEEAWDQGHDAREAARSAVVAMASAAVGRVRELVEAAHPDGTGSAPDARRLPPLFDPRFLDELPQFAPPRLARQWRGTQAARRQLEPLRPALESALSRYSAALWSWGRAQLDAAAAAATVDGVSGPAGPFRDPDLARLAGLLGRSDDPPGEGDEWT